MLAGGRIAKGAAALMVVVTVMAGAISGVAAQQRDEVDVQVEAGDRGQVVSGASVPVRVVLSSERARTVTVQLDWNQGVRTYRSELPAGARVDLDLSLPMAIEGPGQIRAEVSDGSADHCYMLVGGCTSPSGLDAGFKTGSAAWQMEANQNWLKSYVTP